jgi:hypothetical protein
MPPPRASDSRFLLVQVWLTSPRLESGPSAAFLCFRRPADAGSNARAPGVHSAARRHNLAQPQHNTEFILAGQTALEPYDGNDGLPRPSGCD